MSGCSKAARLASSQSVSLRETKGAGRASSGFRGTGHSVFHQAERRKVSSSCLLAVSVLLDSALGHPSCPQSAPSLGPCFAPPRAARIFYFFYFCTERARARRQNTSRYLRVVEPARASGVEEIRLSGSKCPEKGACYACARESSVRLAGCWGSLHALELQLHTGP